MASESEIISPARHDDGNERWFKWRLILNYDPHIDLFISLDFYPNTQNNFVLQFFK